MNTLNRLRLLLVVFFLPITVRPTTTVVPVGTDIQSVINAASSGDTLVFEPGVYSDTTVYFGKPLKVLAASESGTPSVSFAGDVLIQHGGASTSTFQGISFGGPVTISEATASFIDVNLANSLGATQANLTFKRVFAHSITLTDSSVDALRLTAQEKIETKATGGNMPSFLAVQSQFLHPLLLNSTRVWIAYSTFSWSLDGLTTAPLNLTQCDSLFLGNKFTIQTPPDYGLILLGGNVRFLNNAFVSNSSPVRLGSGVAGEFINNSFRSIIRRTGAVGLINFKGNIFKEDVEMAPSINSIYFSYCLFQKPNQPVVNTPILNCLFGVDPKTSADMLTLLDGSPCINAGMPESIYNNRDGTRNTIGYTGGPYLNPAHYSNNNPMVFFLSGPRVVPKSATSIPITATAIAGQ